MAYSDDRNTHTATIAAAGSLSSAVKMGGSSLVGMVIGATFDANTVYLQFLVSMDGTTYNLLKDNDGTLVAVTVAATNTNLNTWLDPAKFAPWRYIKVATYATDGSTVQTQTAETSFTLISAKVTG